MLKTMAKPVSKSVEPTKVESKIAESITLYLPESEQAGFLAWVADAKPKSVELREILAELIEDMSSLKSIERGMAWAV